MILSLMLTIICPIEVNCGGINRFRPKRQANADEQNPPAVKKQVAVAIDSRKELARSYVAVFRGNNWLIVHEKITGGLKINQTRGYDEQIPRLEDDVFFGFALVKYLLHVQIEGFSPIGCH